VGLPLVSSASGLEWKQHRLLRKARPAGERPLFFDIACFFIETVGAMSATTFAAIAAFEVEFFGETFVAFRCKVEIFALDWYIFFILFEHRAKIEI
jgi:hypothetical protein